MHNSTFPADPTRAHWPALLASLALHLIVLVGLVWFVAGNPTSGTTEAPNVLSVGMAIVHRMPDRTLYVTQPPEQVLPADSAENSSAADAATPQTTGGESPLSETNNAPNIGPPIDLAAVLAELTAPAGGAGNGTGEATADSLVNGKIRLADGRSPDELGNRQLVPGTARVGLGAGQTTTEVFGVSGTGSTFVYVFDRSESMKAASSAPLRAAKSELIRSLKTLTERQQFQIIFYNDEPDVFRSQGDQVGLVMGESATIARACEYVQRTVATGGTEHEPALKMALRLAPDVIFFLTDAKIQTMSERQLADITRRAENAGTTIHAIQFGTGPAPENTFLEQLIRRGGGGYRYVDVTYLK